MKKAMQYLLEKCHYFHNEHYKKENKTFNKYYNKNKKKDKCYEFVTKLKQNHKNVLFIHLRKLSF